MQDVRLLDQLLEQLRGQHTRARAEAAGWLGADVAGSGRAFRLQVRMGAGSYVCGEETAMLESLEGRRGIVRAKPPLPAVHGLFGCPTVINNVLTFAAVPTILARGADFYRGYGVGRSHGTLPFQLGGNIRHGGLVEKAFGLTLRELVFGFGGGTASGRPVKLRLDRDDDMRATGKRHDFRIDYDVGFAPDGRITGLRLGLASRCGFSADLSGPVNDRAVFHADNAYYLDAVAIRSLRCRTHTVSNTAFRGFGGPQGMFTIESVLDDIARHLGLDPLAVRRANFYAGPGRDLTTYGMRVEDDIIAPLVERLASSADYAGRRAEIAAFNATSQVLKRGLALTPVKFGISFTNTFLNQAGALVHVYKDGSVGVSHGGTEMGQGLYTKVRQIVAAEFGLAVGDVRLSATDTTRVPNTSATAASSGSDLNGKAAQAACRAIRGRLAAFVAGRLGMDAASVCFEAGRVRAPGFDAPFAQVARDAWRARVQLWDAGFYATPKLDYDASAMRGRPFYYFAYGAALSEVAIDTLTGEHRLLRVDILHDAGSSINPGIDIGQIEGGFIQGLGWLTSEELVFGPDGALLTHSPSTYKIPTAADLPPVFNVRLWDQPNREDAIHRSKAVGEPPLMLAFSVFFALRDAVAAALGPGARADGDEDLRSALTTAPRRARLEVGAGDTSDRETSWSTARTRLRSRCRRSRRPPPHRPPR